MRTAAKVDQNQKEIVKALRDVGASVQILSAVGKGCPDILVSYQGLMFTVEIKDGTKSLSAQALTQAEQEWHAEWKESPVFILNSVENIPVMLEAVEAHYVQALR